MGLGLGSLLIDYAQLNGAYLTRALNDDGPLGWSTRALLKIQHERMAGMPVLSKDNPRPLLQRAAKDFHLLRKISILKEAKLTLSCPIQHEDMELKSYLHLEESTLVDLMCNAGYDPLCLGLNSEIPPKVYMPLFHLGIKSIKQVLKPSDATNRKIIIAASALQKLFPNQKIGAKHKRALNSLTLILNGCDYDYDPVQEAKTTDLSVQQRTILNKSTLERIEAIHGASLDDIHEKLRQKSVAAFPSHEMPEHTVEQLGDRSGRVVDITSGKRMKQETCASKAFECREALPEFDQIVEALLERDITNNNTKQRKTRPNKRKADDPEFELSALEKLLAEVPTQASREAYINYLREDCELEQLILSSYDDFFQIDSISGERYVCGKKQYLIDWAPHPIRNEHTKVFMTGDSDYKCTRLDPLPLNSHFRNLGYDSMAYWESSWEPEEIATDLPEHQAKLNEFLARRQEANARPRATKRKDDRLSNLERQGHWPDLSRRQINPIHLNPDIKQYINIDPNSSINPDKDIRETGAFCMQSSTSNEHMTDMFGPNGKFLGSLLTSRLAILRKAYTRPDISNHGKARMTTDNDFAEAVARLMVRYKNGHVSDTSNVNTTLKNHWATPDKYMQALIEGLGLQTERFASPLNFTPSMQHYYSLYKEDECFGANHDAFSCMWTGASQSNPEYEHPDMEKAVRWAIISAKDSGQPSLTAFVLPWWEDSAYFKWMKNSHVHKITRVKAKYFKFKKADYSTRGELYAKNPKWDVNIFIVANELGIQTYVNLSKLHGGLRAAAREFGDKGPYHVIKEMMPGVSQSQEHVHTPKALRKIMDDNCSQNQPHAWSEALHSPHELNLPSSPFPLKWPAKSMWYTDGSALKADKSQRIGAGVFNANANIARRVQCCGSGPTNTITRAELCALYQCLKELADDENKIIATDSKVIMFMVDNGIWSADANIENKHKALLQAIVNRIFERAIRGRQTTIVKVKSHIGIIGNEEADKLARSAAESSRKSDAHVRVAGAFGDCFWLAVEREEENITREGHTGESSHQMVSNLHTALKSAARPSCQTGMTNETMYVRIWKDVKEDLDLKASNAFWTSKAISSAAIKQTLRARFGVLHHMGQAYKMRRPYLPGLPVARNKQCPLCGEEDSATHILNACKCPEMKALYIERHNQAGRLILKDILKGGKGNNKIFADLGSEEKMRDLGTFDSRLTNLITDQDMLQNGLEIETRNKIRPDILFIRDNDKSKKRKRGMKPAPSTMTAHVAEIGYTSEGRYHKKHAEKLEQHQQLERILHNKGYTVKTHIMILGSAGGIFKKTMEDIASLGVDRSRCDSLRGKLHIHSIHWLHTIIRKRRQLEHGSSTDSALRSPRTGDNLLS